MFGRPRPRWHQFQRTVTVLGKLLLKGQVSDGDTIPLPECHSIPRVSVSDRRPYLVGWHHRLKGVVCCRWRALPLHRPLFSVVAPPLLHPPAPIFHAYLLQWLRGKTATSPALSWHWCSSLKNTVEPQLCGLSLILDHFIACSSEYLPGLLNSGQTWANGCQNTWVHLICFTVPVQLNQWISTSRTRPERKKWNWSVMIHCGLFFRDNISRCSFSMCIYTCTY